MENPHAHTFLLPDLGEGLVEAAVLAWLVHPGDAVERNQPLVEVETAKSAVEIPSPHAGTVARLHAAEGETVPVGAPLVTIATGPEPPPGPGIVGTVPAEEPPARRVRLRPPPE
ncbi:biotin/lipoyl-containing protein [Marinactinospora rubrisoli]|uniref:Biotin/lipoyl-containing protein n=1 Tax=Marinactinospora rubrisoli TaxID=2715399 RepID=A0ABW2KJZ5_9ACTN